MRDRASAEGSGVKGREAPLASAHVKVIPVPTVVVVGRVQRPSVKAFMEAVASSRRGEARGWVKELGPAMDTEGTTVLQDEHVVDKVVATYSVPPHTVHVSVAASAYLWRAAHAVHPLASLHVSQLAMADEQVAGVPELR